MACLWVAVLSEQVKGMIRICCLRKFFLKSMFLREKNPVYLDITGTFFFLSRYNCHTFQLNGNGRWQAINAYRSAAGLIILEIFGINPIERMEVSLHID